MHDRRKGAYKLNPEIMGKCWTWLSGEHYKGLPTAAALADYLGVAKKTIHNWADGDNNELEKEFREFYDAMLARQEALLWDHALSKTWSYNMSQFALANFGHAKPIESLPLDQEKLVHEVRLSIEDGEGGKTKATLHRGPNDDINIQGVEG